MRIGLPTGASQKLDDGVVIVDYDACITCGYCMSACPYGARVLNEGKGNYFGEYAQAPTSLRRPALARGREVHLLP